MGKLKQGIVKERKSQKDFSELSLDEFRDELEYVALTGNRPRVKGFGMKDWPIQKVLEEEERNKVVKKKDYMRDIKIQKTFLDHQTKHKKEKESIYDRLQDDFSGKTEMIAKFRGLRDLSAIYGGGRNETEE